MGTVKYFSKTLGMSISLHPSCSKDREKITKELKKYAGLGQGQACTFSPTHLHAKWSGLPGDQSPSLISF